MELSSPLGYLPRVADHRTPQLSPVELKARIELEREGGAFLEFRSADGSHRLEPLGDGDTSIGRDEQADVTIAGDEQVSRVHAVLERIGGAWTVADDGLSRNGTFVEGERVVGRRRLRHRDTIRVGATLIVFHDPALAEVDATAAAPSNPVDAAPLTATQKSVLVALCRPYRDGSEFATPATNKEIAAELFLSVEAVKGHLRTLFERFGVGADVPQNQKRVKLAENALRSGAVSARDLAG